MNETLNQIARDHLAMDTLETRNSDELDFVECSVWAIKGALEAAYKAGREAGPPKDAVWWVEPKRKSGA